MFDEENVSHLSPEQVLRALYEPECDAERKHLDACERCQAEVESCRRTLDHVSSWTPPSRPADYGASVWNRIAPQLRRRPASLWTRIIKWAWVPIPAAGLAALFMTFAVYRRTPPPQVAAISAAPASERLLQVAVEDHVRRASTVLHEIEAHHANRAVARSQQPAVDTEVLSSLVAENRLYRQTAEQEHDRRTAQLLAGLEPALLALKHETGRPNPADLRDLRRKLAEAGPAGSSGSINLPPSKSQSSDVKRIPL